MCPAEIAEGKAGTVIIDNDDLKDDDLTRGMTLHRTNMMFCAINISRDTTDLMKKRFVTHT